MTATMKANELFEKAFNAPREARSDEYKDGVLQALQFKTEEIDGVSFPYKMGTAQADAWFAGLDEGKRIFERTVKK